MDAIREVGPGGHYLGCAHTQANFKTAFWRSNIADNNSFEQWQAEGEKTAPQRANETGAALAGKLRGARRSIRRSTRR
jgi:trimethylamine--corrinoid protein Co-methyltransferase